MQLDRALQIWPRVPDANVRTGLEYLEVLRRAGLAALDSGAAERATALLGEALGELDNGGDQTLRAGLMERLGMALLQAGKTDEGIAVLRTAISLPAEQGTPRTHAAALVALANALFRNIDWDEVEQLARQGADAARAAGEEGMRVEAEIPLAVVRTIRGEHEAGLAAGRIAIDEAVRLGHPITAIRGFINFSDILERLGRSTEAVALATEGRTVADRFGFSRSSGAFLAGNQAESLAHLGRYREAASIVDSRLAFEPEGVIAATLLDVRCQVALRQGEYDIARAALVRARAMVGEHAEPQFTRGFAINEVSLRIATDDYLGAAAAVRDELSQPGTEPRYDWILVWLAYAVHAARPGIPIDPVVITTRERLDADVDPQLAYDVMCTAELARAEGGGDAAAWSPAIELWRAMQRPYELALCLLRAAEADVATGKRAQARHDAAEAYEIASGIGAVPLAEQIAAFARRARLDVVAEAEPTDLAQRFNLTVREHEVLLLVADGRTNPEIAKMLFISPKTASVHVSNILAKLGVSSRVEAATLADRLRSLI